MTDFPPTPKPSGPKRTIRRIVAEALVVALLGTLVLGLGWEVGERRFGDFAAACIWICGLPALEILRMGRSKRKQ